MTVQSYLIILLLITLALWLIPAPAQPAFDIADQRNSGCSAIHKETF